MHRKILYLLPFLIMALSSCLKDNTDTTPLPVPSGTFSGQFIIYHKSKATGKIDTTKSNFTMDMNTTAVAGYKVTSDTTTTHAGSYGDFSINPQYILFVDKTASTTGVPPAKVHLAGVYVYQFDGSSVFKFYTTASDTIIYQYDLKKIK